MGIAACALVVLCCPGTVRAATVSAGYSVVADGTGVVFHDATAPLQPGDGCTALDPSTARCEVAGRTTGLGVQLDLGAGDDRYIADASAVLATVRAGDGNDVVDLSASQTRFDGAAVRGDAGDDVLIGSPGPDVIYDGPGADRVDGGTGPDIIRVGTGTDHLDGGLETDHVEWVTPGPVHVDLADPGPDGLSDEPDELVSIEAVTGGPGSVLLGSAGRDVLQVERGVADGRGGDDEVSGRGTLRGGRGDDRVSGNGRLSGGPGDDLLEGGRDLDGGPGDDELRYPEALRATVRCGGGADLLRLSRRGDDTPVLGPACERIDVSGLLIAAWRVSRRTLTVRIGTSGSLGVDRCRTRLRSGGETTPRLRLRRRPRTIVLPAGRRRATLRVLDGPRSACSGLGDSRLHIRFATGRR